MMKGARIVTKTAIKRELRNVRTEQEWLMWCEQAHDPDWRFRSQPYSKRRARVVKTWWALKAVQAR